MTVFLPGAASLSGATDPLIVEARLDDVLELNVILKNVSVAGMQALARWPIEKLDLADGNDAGTPGKVLAPLGTMARLTELQLSMFGLVEDADIAFLGTLERLRRLHLFGNYRLADTTCRIISTMNLTDVKIEGSEDITDSGVSYLAGAASITDLSLPPFAAITDAGLAALAAGSAPLRSLWFGALRAVTDAGIVALGTCATLRHLRMKAMPHITPDTLDRLRKMLPELVVEIDRRDVEQH